MGNIVARQLILASSKLFYYVSKTKVISRNFEFEFMYCRDIQTVFLSFF